MCNLDKKKGQCFPVRVTNEIVLIHLSFFTLNAGKMLKKINETVLLEIPKAFKKIKNQSACGICAVPILVSKGFNSKAVNLQKHHT